MERDLRNCEQEHEEEDSHDMKSEGGESNNTQWTDEKHSSYLKSMEASFVNQLYGSSHQDEKKSSNRMHNIISTPSGQFKAFKDGSWERVSFSNREMHVLKKIEKSSHIMASPWIQHYRSLGKHQPRKSPSPPKCGPASASDDSSASQLGGQDSTDNNAEASGQNFDDEVPKEEKPRRTNRNRQKCRKISAASGFSNDQVVPFDKLSLVDNMVNGSPQ